MRDLYALQGVTEYDEHLSATAVDENRRLAADASSRITRYLSRNPNSDIANDVYDMGQDMQLLLQKCMMSRTYNLFDFKVLNMLIRRPLFAERVLRSLDNRFLSNAPYRIGLVFVSRIIEQIKNTYKERHGWSSQAHAPDQFSDSEDKAVWGLTQLFKLYTNINPHEGDRLSKLTVAQLEWLLKNGKKHSAETPLLIWTLSKFSNLQMAKSLLCQELFESLSFVYVISTRSAPDQDAKSSSQIFKDFLADLNANERTLYMTYLLDILVSSPNYSDGLLNLVANLTLIMKVHQGHRLE